MNVKHNRGEGEFDSQGKIQNGRYPPPPLPRESCRLILGHFGAFWRYLAHAPIDDLMVRGVG
jgi:hypothetical protein